jgi:Ti-type conjugative transfer relaxase TraA
MTVLSIQFARGAPACADPALTIDFRISLRVEFDRNVTTAHLYVNEFRSLHVSSEQVLSLAIYHLTVKVISRGRGQSITAAAAYRSGASLRDERYGVTRNYTRNRPAAHAEIIAPAGAPIWVHDRQTLWNRVEAGERRKDAQLARAIEIGLPVELSPGECVALLRDYIAQEFVSKGMIADFCIRRNDANNPYAQILLTLRAAEPCGFGLKMRAWNRKSNLFEWRAAWAERANRHLACAGHAVRIDHRTLEAQQSELTPGRKIGVGRSRQSEEALPDHLKERVAERHEISRDNGEMIREDPTLALRAMTRQRMTFTREDMARFLRSRTDGAAQLDAVLGAVMACSELAELSPDAAGEIRFTSKDMIEAEKSLMKRVTAMAVRRRPGAGATAPNHEPPSHALTRDQDRVAGQPSEFRFDDFGYLAGDGDIKALAPASDAAKHALLAAIRELWESWGMTVIGTAVSRIATEQLQERAGIVSQTVESQEQAWQEGQSPLTANHVMVIEGAEMIGLKQLERLLAIADKARSKVVLLGDAVQLETMGALSPLRGILDRVGPAPGRP